ncbi:MAG: reverse transcriptase domain-containing protein [Patescibacteria group bacterium]
MKTYKNLFEKFCSFENLHGAYSKARKCKRYRDYVLQFSYNLEENLFLLQEELINQTYHCGQYKEFIINDSKKRLIKAPTFRDRIVHHALCNIIEPIFEKSFIFDSYACRKEKGTHKAVLKLKGFLKNEKNTYCLKCDVRKFFENIDHKILLELIERRIKDDKILRLIKEIVASSFDHKIFENLFDFRLSGVPLGNLTSQLFANIYLNELDKFAKHKLRIRYYIRYMDDFIILGDNKEGLGCFKEKVKRFLKECLKLDAHPKKCNILPTRCGIDFLGYIVFKNFRLLRKSSVKRFTKRMKFYRKRVLGGKMPLEKFSQSLNSWLSYAKFGNSWRLREHLINIRGL